VKILLLAALACAPLLRGQGEAPPAADIRIFSEFQRFDPFGNIVAADRGTPSREILSPAVARNGHLTVHVAVTAPPNTNYFLYAASNPADLVDITIYREYYAPCGTGYCPDFVVRVPSPSFGAIPESTELANETTRCYLLDIHAHSDTPPRRVRVETLLKVGTWEVAPMEVRIMEPLVPDNASNSAPNGAMEVQSEIAPLDAPAGSTAQLQLLRFLAGERPSVPPALLRTRDFEQRNAAEDMLLASTLGVPRGGPQFPEMNLMLFQPLTYPALSAEWYLRVRDFLDNFGQ
jgi:hypothetical protein